MKRLLNIVGTLNQGGAETFLMKVYDNLNTKKYQMDFCVMKKEKDLYEDDVIAKGGRVFHVIPKSENALRCFSEIRCIVKENNYKYAMRVNEHSLSVIDLIAAKCGGARVLAMRSSNANSGNRKSEILHRMFSILPRVVPNVKMAPSDKAAEYTFGKKAVKAGAVAMLNNGIPVNKYLFNEETRVKKRKELGVTDQFVIGHVGRFYQQKNHGFLIDIFKEITKRNSCAVLVLVGEGYLMDSCKQKVHNYGLKDRVKFLGSRNDVNELYSAFDVLLFPSLYEGMPNVVIESQASGLHCVISDTITKEADITGLVDYVSLEDDAEYWAAKVLQYSNRYIREDTSEKFIKNGYDIQSVVDRFVELVFQEEV